MTELILQGCHPEPLASYLKALAVLRLVAEQADPGAVGWWEKDCFHLRSSLDEAGLLDFFTTRWVPTPIVSPWNGGSGFYDGDNREGMDAILASADPRFKEYRSVIEQVARWPEMPQRFETLASIVDLLTAERDSSRPGKKRDELDALVQAIEEAREGAESVLGEPVPARIDGLESRAASADPKLRASLKPLLDAARKARSECKRLARSAGKEELLATARARLPESALGWLDALVALGAQDKPSYNPLLGAGGNEGRLDFSNNQMQWLSLLLLGDVQGSRTLLRGALFGEVTAKLQAGAIGQFHPGRAGGFNQGIGVENKGIPINPWDFVLMLEGTAWFGASVARRHTGAPGSLASIPFTVHLSGVGFTSAEAEEKGKAELWLPLWSAPASAAELGHLFGEGRCTLGRRSARTGLDFTRGLSTLGVDRGIESFARYAFLERRGMSYVATPTGRLSVRFRPEIRLLDELDRNLDTVDSYLRTLPNVPASFASARRNLDRALWACCESPEPARTRELVLAIGAIERLFARRGSQGLRAPLGGLSTRWILQADDGSPELRIAAALASVRGEGSKIGGLRSHLCSVDPARPWSWAQGEGERSWSGSNLPERLGSALQRRVMSCTRAELDHLPLASALALRPEDIVPFLLGLLDDTLIEEFLWGFSWISDWKGAAAVQAGWRKPLVDQPIPREWALLRLAFWPGSLRGIRVYPEPRVIGRLLAGDADGACALALRRLQVDSLNPLPVTFTTSLDPIRLAASLLIPIVGSQALETLVLTTQNNQGAET